MKEHILVVGSGIAGLIAALQLCARYEVTLVTKAELAEGNTRWAQGGIAAAMFPDDSVAEHVADTLRAGAGLCRMDAVEVLCAEGPARIYALIRLGVAFDQADGVFARGLEAAHSRARVLHARGDATGYSIEAALVHAVRAADISVLEHTFARELLFEGDRLAGLKVLGPNGEQRRLQAEVVILASGGAGQLYLHTTNPRGATGDGLAVALAAGAQIADVEFYQFHPTALASPETFLISEAVRGEGAILLNAQGARFMQAIHPAAELAPRDVVARGIAAQMSAQQGKPVLLDATSLGAEFLRQRFPSIDAACRSRGLDWTKEPIPVTPAAHYWMGGVRADLWGRTSIPGLFAIGEVACTGVHGANRLASNSLLESLVFAWRSAGLLLQQNSLRSLHNENWPCWEMDEPDGFDVQPQGGTAVELPDRKSLQTLMWRNVGIERDGAALKQTLAQLNRWSVDGEDVESIETANLLSLARVATAAALARRESRGAHYRRDYPDSSQEWQHSLIYEQKISVPC